MDFHGQSLLFHLYLTRFSEIERDHQKWRKTCEKSVPTVVPNTVTCVTSFTGVSAEGREGCLFF